MAKQLQLLWHAFNRTLERLLPFTWISRANHYLFSNRECLSHPHNQHAQPGVVMLRRKPNQARYNDISNYAVMTRRKLFPKPNLTTPFCHPQNLNHWFTLATLLTLATYATYWDVRIFIENELPSPAVFPLRGAQTPDNFNHVATKQSQSYNENYFSISEVIWIEV